MPNVYKFSKTAKEAKTAKETKPDTDTTRLLEKAQDGKALTREEKDKIANILYGTFGAQSSTYKLRGWAWPMHETLKRILVSFDYEPGIFHTYYAPDKTSLRKALSGSGSIHEMIEA